MTIATNLAFPVAMPAYTAPFPVTGTLLQPASDALAAGSHRITGSTKNTGAPTTPVSRRVRLHHQATGALVRELWSDAVTGAYAFDNLPAGTYYVVSFDHTGLYNGEIATDLVSEPMVFA